MRTKNQEMARRHAVLRYGDMKRGTLSTLAILTASCVALAACGGGTSAWTAPAPVPAPVPTQAAISLLNSNGQALKAFQFAGASAQLRPAVVMMHGCAGVYSNSLPDASFSNVQTIYRDWAQALASKGYVVIVVDSFSGRKDPITGQVEPQNQCGNGAGVGISEVTDRPLDALAAHAYLVAHPELAVDMNRVALLGWSHGGSSVMATLSATQTLRPFRAGLAFYPGCGLNNAYGGLAGSTYTPYAPFKLLQAELDPLYTGGACQKRYERAVLLGSAHFKAMDLLAGARHSFDGCKAASATCTAADVAAKGVADPLALSFFEDQFK